MGRGRGRGRGVEIIHIIYITVCTDISSIYSYRIPANLRVNVSIPLRRRRNNVIATSPSCHAPWRSADCRFPSSKFKTIVFHVPNINFNFSTSSHIPILGNFHVPIFPILCNDCFLAFSCLYSIFQLSFET